MPFEKFWRQHPALFYGLAALSGTSVALHHYWTTSLFLVLAWPLIGAHHRKLYALRLALALTLALSCFCLTSHRFLFPKPEESNVKGIAHIEISSIAFKTMHFGSLWKAKGTLLSFLAESDKSLIAQNIPITLIIPRSDAPQRPEASYRYLLHGRLKENRPGRYTLIVDKTKPWHPTEKVFNLTEWRYAAKASLQEYLRKSFEDPHVAAFLSGIVTGDTDDMQLSIELNRFGLQHLLAISGLHYSILASLLGFVTYLIFSRHLGTGLLILFLSAYFLFLGSSPSVLRAWLAASIGLAGLMLGKRSLALNSLGIGILIIALIDPLAIQTISFQFSFAITGAILVWYGPCDAWLQKIFAKRHLSQIKEVGLWDQHGYFLLCFLRQALALSFAVNIVALPLTLFYFQKFPLLGLIYNLFFPFMISLSMLLLVVAFIFHPLIPWISAQIHALNESYTHFLLNFTFNLPKNFDLKITFSGLSAEIVMIYLLVAFVIGINVKNPKDDLIAIT